MTGEAPFCPCMDSLPDSFFLGEQGESCPKGAFKLLSAQCPDSNAVKGKTKEELRKKSTFYMSGVV